ncbi:MAG: luciferase family protein [Thiolinea sp.]
MKSKVVLQQAILTALLVVGSISVLADADSLPMRETPRPMTTNGVPHVQINVEPIPELAQELLRRVAMIPDVEIRETVISLPGAKGFWLNDALPLTHPGIIIGGREFAHMHPDGSLHASLPVPLAQEAIAKGWAISHPWSKQRAGWEGFVMVYSPMNMTELDVVIDLVTRSYNFITGRNYD